MLKSKKAITVSVFGGISLFALVVGAVFAINKAHQSDQVTAQGYQAPSSQQQTASEDAVLAAASENSAPSASPTSQSPAAGQGQNTAPGLSGSSLNSEDGHETSNPPNDELIAINPDDDFVTTYTGTLVGTVTNVVNVSPGAPSSYESVPLVATVVIKDVKGSVVKTVTSDTNGKFAVTLGTGKYTVVPQSIGDFYFTPTPWHVEIKQNESTNVYFGYSPIAFTNALVF